MSVSSASSNDSFDFDRFSLSSDDNDERNNENIFEEKNINKDFATHKMSNINKNKEINKEKKNVVNIFLDMLNKTCETEDTSSTKYLPNILKFNIPKYITERITNVPCDNCKNNIWQRIGSSFTKILDKHYFLCCICKAKFITEINLLTHAKFEEMEKNNQYSVCTKNVKLYQSIKKLTETHKFNLNSFAHFLENFMSNSDINCIVMEITEKSFDNIKYIKPYPNIRIYNFDMEDYRFTNQSRVKSLLKNGFIEKIDDVNYKFLKEEYGNHYEYRAEATNKCINCKTELNLNKFRLEVTKYNKEFKNEINKYENIYYLLYAVCNGCVKHCDIVQKKCIKYFVELYKLKNFREVITQEINNKNISKFLKIYNDAFMELLENENENKK